MTSGRDNAHAGKPDATRASSIPFVELDPEKSSPESCFHEYFDSASAFADIQVDLTTENRGVIARSWLLDQLMFLEADVGAHTANRTERHIRRDQCDTLMLLSGPGAPTRMILDGSPVLIDDGAFHVVDYSRPQIEYCNDEFFRCVYLPYQAVGYNPDVHPAHLRIGFQTPAGRILLAAYQELYRLLPSARLDQAPNLAAGFIGMLKGLLFNSSSFDAGETMFHHSRDVAMKRYLDSRLQQPDLSATHLQKAFSTSRATVFRHFAGEGGVSEYIYRRRLERAYLELCGAPTPRGQVTRTALNWGFSSVSHFTRRFQQHFGFPPSEAVGGKPAHLTRISDQSEGTSIHGFGVIRPWINHLGR